MPNFSAPWVYSLLTAFSGAGLLLIVTWRNGLSDRSDATRRARRWVISVYAGVIVALWVLFALADAPVERVRDLDTYYADTPFMREMIVLYLLGHTVAVLITGRLIWNWVRADGLHGWLRWGLTFLGAGYALNLGFDLAKLTAVAARWTGHDLDTLSTDIAPCAACLGAILIAVGFILPHTGQYLHGRLRVRLAHHQLRPLYVLMRSVDGDGVPFVLCAAPELRLIRRETYIRDVLLPLARRLDDDLRTRAHQAALSLGCTPPRAKALAAAVAILDAIDPAPGTPPATPTPPTSSRNSAPSPAPCATATRSTRCARPYGVRGRRPAPRSRPAPHRDRSTPQTPRKSPASCFRGDREVAESANVLAYCSGAHEEGDASVRRRPHRPDARPGPGRARGPVRRAGRLRDALART